MAGADADAQLWCFVVATSLLQTNILIIYSYGGFNTASSLDPNDRISVITMSVDYCSPNLCNRWCKNNNLLCARQWD